MNEKQLMERMNQAVERYPELRDRYARGAMIYRENRIRRIANCTVSVPSQSGKMSYLISEEIDGAHCSCQDYSRKAPNVNGQTFCKHVIAYRLWEKNGDYEAEQNMETENELLFRL